MTGNEYAAETDWSKEQDKGKVSKGRNTKCQNRSIQISSLNDTREKILPRNYCGITAELLRNYCGITAELLRNYCGITAELLRNYCGITAELLRNYCGITAELLRNYCGITVKQAELLYARKNSPWAVAEQCQNFDTARPRPSSVKIFFSNFDTARPWPSSVKILTLLGHGRAVSKFFFKF